MMHAPTENPQQANLKDRARQFAAQRMSFLDAVADRVRTGDWPHTALMLAYRLSSQINRTDPKLLGWAWADYDWLAKHCKLSVRTVTRLMGLFRQAGLLVTKRRGKQLSNLHRL